ncbi:16S rRNA (uracil(1498)-N(3))-methyltransferase [Staphylococcus sp. SQ8-PEA]|uniref:Ribosomal RNA small subunit methyltransferase E n=1 Tax=Staphylococcus marylandisciuri TaxID=2981529 RepID=A0ABT2QQX8_9STAP|nr:16S rRNA (uracil(1498)-N(3))-methyltransferase [Staphylococcus marylandisciuri]MCU5746395.1 16S rRNA (uracil(1498)-N(3))-methyltransferase [Staphylococcus marylandisciuri]
MQRYFIHQNADENQRFFIKDENDVHHIKNVMRNSVGNQIIVTFNDEKVYECQITQIEEGLIEVSLTKQLETETELPLDITVCSGLIKADKYEWLVQKATELGANHFIATEMERSVVKLNSNKVTKKLQRWEKIIKEAAEQSYRLTIPTIDYVSNLKQIYDRINEYDYVLIAYEDAAKRGEKSTLKQLIKQFNNYDRVLVIFGPEGGLSEKEINMFTNKAYQVGLGPRILRAETAPLYFLSAVSFEKDLTG